jgi:hypothetical protein
MSMRNRGCFVLANDLSLAISCHFVFGVGSVLLAPALASCIPRASDFIRVPMSE